MTMKSRPVPLRLLANDLLLLLERKLRQESGKFPKLRLQQMPINEATRNSINYFKLNVKVICSFRLKANKSTASSAEKTPSPNENRKFLSKNTPKHLRLASRSSSSRDESEQPASSPINKSPLNFVPNFFKRTKESISRDSKKGVRLFLSEKKYNQFVKLLSCLSQKELKNDRFHLIGRLKTMVKQQWHLLSDNASPFRTGLICRLSPGRTIGPNQMSGNSQF